MGHCHTVPPVNSGQEMTGVYLLSLILDCSKHDSIYSIYKYIEKLVLSLLLYDIDWVVRLVVMVSFF